jgi:transcriptional regulator with XRE-family HTH domain
MATMTSSRDHEINIQIGQRLAGWRTGAGLTIRELADCLGWPHTTLGNYESGRRALSIARLYEIAAALGHAPATLLVDEPEAAAIVDQVARDPERAAQVAFVLETLDDALPEPPEADR